MKKFVTRAIIIALIGSTGILSGCYGPFRLTTKLHQWNGNVSNKKFVNELSAWTRNSVFKALPAAPVTP